MFNDQIAYVFFSTRTVRRIVVNRCHVDRIPRGLLLLLLLLLLCKERPHPLWMLEEPGHRRIGVGLRWGKRIEGREVHGRVTPTFRKRTPGWLLGLDTVSAL